jgi:hypothetical protein
MASLILEFSEILVGNDVIDAFFVRQIGRRLASRLVSVVFISGGTLGVLAIMPALQSVHGIGEPVLLVVFTALYIVGIAEGVMLLEKKQLHSNLVTFLLLLQVPIIRTYPISFDYSSFMFASVTFTKLFSYNFEYSFGSQWSISFFTTPSVPGIGINFFPLVVMFLSRLITGAVKADVLSNS